MMSNVFLRGRQSRGFTLFECILCAAILGIGTLILADAVSQEGHVRQARLAAEHMRIFSSAMRGYIRENAESLLKDADGETPILVKASTLTETGFLPSTFSSQNIYGQSVCALLLKSPSTQVAAINALVVSEGGTALSDAQLASVVTLIGGEGGGIFSGDANTIRGSVGGWSMEPGNFAGVNDQGQTCSGTAGNIAFSAGHFYQALWLNEYQGGSKLLSRTGNPDDPETNRMETNLDMNGHFILNALDVDLKGLVTAGAIATTGDLQVNEAQQLDGSATVGGTCEKDGLMGHDAHGLVLACKEGTWQTLGTPAKKIGYFNASECPVGWKASDGTDGTLDLRGVFVRGLDNGRNIDVGRALGSYQADAIRNIEGTYTVARGPYYNGRQEEGVLYATDDGHGGGGKLKRWDGDGMFFDASRVVPTSDEFRPKNIALLACEKE